VKKYLFTILIILISFSCSTVIDNYPPYIPPLQNVLIGDIEKSIQSGSFLDAFALTDRFSREKENISRERLAELRGKSLQGIVDAFNAALKADDFHKALVLYLSLKNIKEQSRCPDWSPEKLYYGYAEKLEKAGENAVALLIYQRAIDTGNLSGEQFTHIMQLAAKTGDTTALVSVIGEMERKGLAVPPVMKEKSTTTVPVATMINGTVTIWVDRGVKIENGVGMLDRVIGSGFFIDPRGYLLTNYHVIASEVDPKYEGYSRLFVRLSEKPEQKIPARVIGFDPVFDLALVKVEIEPKYVFSSIRESEALPGERIRVIGSPIGLENTVTSGIVSAKGRRFLQLGDALQIDAPVNPGNSGGPVIDDAGRLLGVVFAGVPQFQGINFALPSQWVNKVIPRLYLGNQVKHFWTGMAVTETVAGLEAIYIVPGEPADNSGLRSGDIIKKINGKDLATIRDFQMALSDYEDQALVRFTISREGSESSAIVSLSQRPRVPIQTALERDARSNVLFPLFGMKIERVNDSFVSSHYVVRKVLTGTIADELGLSENDPIDIRGWVVDEEHKVVAMEVKVKRKKLGFLETFIQLLSYLEVDNFV
jgi:S1-C subfamily serine protease